MKERSKVLAEKIYSLDMRSRGEKAASNTEVGHKVPSQPARYVRGIAQADATLD